MPKKYGLIGYPLGHTISPYIHSELFKIKGVSATYKAVEISPDDLRENVSLLNDFDGFNVTIPHKNSIIKELDFIDEISKLYGSVNTVKKENGKFYGYNTDAYGFLQGIDRADLNLSGNVFVYGYGGVARTIAFECVKKGCNVTLGVREGMRERAQPLQSEIYDKLKAHVDIKEIYSLSQKYDLFINATPVGMYPKCDASPLTKEQVCLFGGVFDTIYNPQETTLIKYAKECGVKNDSGLAMLVYQAAKAQSIWFDTEFEKQSIEEIIKKSAIKLSKEF